VTEATARDPGSGIVLVDASPYVFRAYYSISPSMLGPRGDPVNGVFGFSRFLVKLLTDEKPSHIAVAFDESLNTSFRNEIYPAYKAQRELPGQDLERQFGLCKELCEALGVHPLADDRYEADDIVGTLCYRFRSAGLPITVVTADKDLAQLVNEGVDFYDFGKGQRMGPEGIREAYGVGPEQIVDYFALAGDTVDNIPGVKGIGKKTAQGLLGQFGSLDAVYERIEEVSGCGLRGARSIQKKLVDGRDAALLSRELARISFDAPVSETLESLVYQGGDRIHLDSLALRLGFKSLAGKVPLADPVDSRPLS